MEHSNIKTYAQEAYLLHTENPGLSSTEKANKFAAFFAYEAASAKISSDQDLAGCIAAQHFLKTMHENYLYSVNRANTNAELHKAKMAHEKARGLGHSPTPDGPQTFFKPEATDIPPCSEPRFESETLKHNTLEDVKATYMRAYCMAFLVFEQAEKTSSQAVFESLIEDKLSEAFVEPFSYMTACFELLMSTEVCIAMTIILLLGLTILALPSLGIGISSLSTTATYTIGGGMLAAGLGFHAWRFFANPTAPDEENMADGFNPQV